MTNLGAPLSLFDHPYNALVVGASGAIGGAFVEAFQSDAHCVHVATVSRTHTPGFDLLREESIAAQAGALKAHAPFHVIIDATGALTIDGVGPEKALSQLNAAALMRQFQTNTIGPALLMRHFAPLLATGPAIYAKLSARVGSISDNKKGGWYGYRASKAALNMVLQTAAIELQRKRPELRVVALQPGTVKSGLSAPFVPSAPYLLAPSDSVSGLLAALKGLDAKAGAHYIDYQGAEIAW